MSAGVIQPAMGRRILGVDPGSHVCGYGVIDVYGRDYKYVECGVLTADRGRSLEARLGILAGVLRDLIDEFQPMVAAVEDVFTHVNPRSAFALAQGRGMALAVLGMAGVTVASYSPAVVKKTVTGSGRAGKEQVARMVSVLAKLSTPPRSDAADALAVAITHAERGTF